MATIAVVIPAYNAEATLPDTLASVLAQTWTDFELIVVNDGSQDGTLALLEGVTDPRLRILSQENGGPQASRNRGLAAVTSPYVAFLDADDLWAPEKLASQLGALEAHPTAAVAYSWTDVIDGAGRVIERGDRTQAQGRVFKALLEHNFLGSGSNPLMRTAAIRAVGGFDRAIVAGQDWDMWLTLAAAYEFVGVPQVQVFYRKVAHSQSWSSNLRRQERGLRQVMAKHLARSEFPPAYRQARLAYCYRYLLFECLGKCRPCPGNGCLALCFWGQTLRREPRWWGRRYPMGAIVLIKITRFLLTWG